jgi:cobalamin biosynthesis Co2+ chelatase CbiK
MHAYYRSREAVLQEMDPNVHIATVDGYPTIYDIVLKLKEKKVVR